MPRRRVSFHLDEHSSRSPQHHQQQQQHLRNGGGATDLDSVEQLVNSYSLERQRHAYRRSYDGQPPRLLCRFFCVFVYVFWDMS